MKLALLLVLAAVSVHAIDFPRKGLPAGVSDQAVDFKFSVDTSAPTISDVQLTSTSPINVTMNDNSIRFTVKASDDGSGVDSVVYGARSPDGTKVESAYCQQAEGNDKTKFSCALYLDKYVQWGTWTMAWVNATDKAENMVSITSPLDGWVTKFDIQSEWDGTPPTLTGMTITPTTLTVGANYQHQEVTFTTMATDARSGPYRVRFFYNYPSGANNYGSPIVDFNTLSYYFGQGQGQGNDRNTATGKTTSAFTYAGDYTLDHVELWDGAKNVKSYTPDEIKAIAKDITTTISVTNNNPAGVIKEAAALVGVAFDRSSLDVAGKDGVQNLWVNVTIATPSPAAESGKTTVSLKSENGDWIDVRCDFERLSDIVTTKGGNTMCAHKQGFSDYQYKSGRYAVSGVSVQTTAAGSIDVYYTVYGQLSPSAEPNAAGALRPSLLVAAALALVALVAAFKA